MVKKIVAGVRGVGVGGGGGEEKWGRVIFIPQG